MVPSEDSAASSEIEPPYEEGVESEGEKSSPVAEPEVPMQEEKEGTPKDGEDFETTTGEIKEDLSKHKTKVASRLARALEELSPDNPYRSPDLVPLTTDFQNMRKKLRSLIASIKAYQTATAKVQDARSKVSLSSRAVSFLLDGITSPMTNFVFL